MRLEPFVTVTVPLIWVVLARKTTDKTVPSNSKNMPFCWSNMPMRFDAPNHWAGLTRIGKPTACWVEETKAWMVYVKVVGVGVERTRNVPLKKPAVQFSTRTEQFVERLCANRVVTVTVVALAEREVTNRVGAKDDPVENWMPLPDW